MLELIGLIVVISFILGISFTSAIGLIFKVFLVCIAIIIFICLIGSIPPDPKRNQKQSIPKKLPIWNHPYKEATSTEKEFLSTQIDKIKKNLPTQKTLSIISSIITILSFIGIIISTTAIVITGVEFTGISTIENVLLASCVVMIIPCIIIFGPALLITVLCAIKLDNLKSDLNDYQTKKAIAEIDDIYGLNEIIEGLYIGQAIEFEYDNKNFVLKINKTKKFHSLCLYNYENNNETEQHIFTDRIIYLDSKDYPLDFQDKSLIEEIESILGREKVFNNKNFFEVFNDVEVLFIG